MVVHRLDGRSYSHAVQVLSLDVVLQLVCRFFREEREAAQIKAGIHNGFIRVLVDVAAQLVLGFGPLDDFLDFFICQTDRADAVPAIDGQRVLQNGAYGLQCSVFALFVHDVAHKGNIDLVGSGRLRKSHPCSHANRVGAFTGGSDAQRRQLLQTVVHADGGYIPSRICRGRTQNQDIVEVGIVGDGGCQRNVNGTNPIEAIAHVSFSSFTSLLFISAFVK